MVKIRYSALPAGQHVAARQRGRSTVVYLLPGLTPAERRAALLTIQTSSRIGRAHRISPLALLCARGADRTKTVGAGTLAAIRKHPALLLPPVAGVAGTILMLLLTAAMASPAAPSQRPEPGHAAATQQGTQRPSALAATPPGLHTTAGFVPLRSLWRPEPWPESRSSRAGAGRAWADRADPDHAWFPRLGSSAGRRGPGPVYSSLPDRGGKPRAPAQPTVPSH